MLRYFAYGSNLLPRRLQAPERTPSARVLTLAQLRGHRIGFCKRGRDGSGKCTVLACDDPASRVHGVVYSLDPAERPALDRVEGAGYHVETLQLDTPGGALEAFAYVADPDAVNPSLLPFGWYHALVVAGARYHGFPDDYVAALAGVAAVADPDRERDRHHRDLIPATLR
ncbi:MAG: gamma-glutamylcyclotransferase [Pseudolabrys sp.]